MAGMDQRKTPAGHVRVPSLGATLGYGEGAHGSEGQNPGAKHREEVTFTFSHLVI